MTIMRLVTLIVGILSTLAPCWGATLVRLSLDEMIEQSTSIVQGQITGERAVKRGPVIYTYYEVEVGEVWKGSEASAIEVAVPGGVYEGLNQHFSGTPQLEQGEEYVLFLWTGKSGVTQVIGLSQGVFDLTTNSDGELIVQRAAITEVMLDAATGRQVEDTGKSVELSALRTRVRTRLAEAEE